MRACCAYVREKHAKKGGKGGGGKRRKEKKKAKRKREKKYKKIVCDYKSSLDYPYPIVNNQNDDMTRAKGGQVHV